MRAPAAERASLMASLGYVQHPEQPSRFVLPGLIPKLRARGEWPAERASAPAPKPSLADAAPIPKLAPFTATERAYLAQSRGWDAGQIAAYEKNCPQRPDSAPAAASLTGADRDRCKGTGVKPDRLARAIATTKLTEKQLSHCRSMGFDPEVYRRRLAFTRAQMGL